MDSKTKRALTKQLKQEIAHLKEKITAAVINDESPEPYKEPLFLVTNKLKELTAPRDKWVPVDDHSWERYEEIGGKYAIEGKLGVDPRGVDATGHVSLVLLGHGEIMVTTCATRSVDEAKRYLGRVASTYKQLVKVSD
jgi:hypothetical protein